MNEIEFTFKVKINTDTKPDESSMKAIGDSAIDGIEANLGPNEKVTAAKFSASSVLTTEAERTYNETTEEAPLY